MNNIAKYKLSTLDTKVTTGCILYSSPYLDVLYELKGPVTDFGWSIFDIWAYIDD